MKELVLATGNPGKIAELQAILAPVQCISQASLGIENIEETGLSFVENALMKARHASAQAKRPALADDSGLVVEALQGAPGIYSSRFAGIHASDADNIACLLEKLKDIPAPRNASFYCTIVMVQHACDPMPVIAFGQLPGLIAMQASGKQGFGYDPVFYLPSHQCTMAELPARIKNSISHRALALAELRERLKR